jgi:hypothetical protein
MRSMKKILKKIGLIVGLYLFPIASCIAFLGICLKYPFALDIFKMLFLCSAFTSTVIILISLVGWVCRTSVKNPLKRWRDRPSHLAARILGAYIGGFAGTLLLYFFAQDLLSGLNDLMNPVMMAKCEADSHHCLGSGLVIVGLGFWAIGAAIPGSILGGYIGNQIRRSFESG